MVSKRIIHLFIVLLVLLPFNTSFGGAKVYLTRDNVSNFIESLPDVREWNQKESKNIPTSRSTYDDSMNFLFQSDQTPFEAILYSARDPYLRSELNKLVQKYGFDDVDQWINVGDRISNAYLSLQDAFVDKEEGKQQLINARKSIAKDKEMPNGYQSVMLGIIGEAEAAVAEIDDISSQELELVKRNVPSLSVMFLR